MSRTRSSSAAFAIDRDEVSVADYRQCVIAGACALDPLVSGDERYIRDEWPLVNVTWNEAERVLPVARRPAADRGRVGARGARRFRRPVAMVQRGREGLRRAARRLQPRPAALARDARGRSRLEPDPAAPDGRSRRRRRLPAARAPGSYPWGEGPYGTRDQAGNVAEWTADARGEHEADLGYLGLRPSTRVARARGNARVVRGGSWRQPAFLARANVRDPFNLLYTPDRRFSHIGFRCARSMP